MDPLVAAVLRRTSQPIDINNQLYVSQLKGNAVTKLFNTYPVSYGKKTLLPCS